MSSRPTRRAVLTAGAVGLVAGCTRSHRPSGAVRPAHPDPDVALTAAAVGRELALLAAYDAALAATPALTSRLAPLRAEHAAHLDALGAGPAGKLTASPAAGPAPAQPRDAGPRDAGPQGVQARRSLVTAERAAGAAHAAATVTASARLAAVLASLAASEASHEVALG